MKNTKKLALLAAVIVLSALTLSGTVSSVQIWPQRIVKLIVPLGPASGADVTARLLADRLSKCWAKAPRAKAASWH